MLGFAQPPWSNAEDQEADLLGDMFGEEEEPTRTDDKGEEEFIWCEGIFVLYKNQSESEENSYLPPLFYILHAFPLNIIIIIPF